MFIFALKKDRLMARELHEKQKLPFFEVHINTPLDECEKRDVKGLYRKAKEAEGNVFLAGLNSIYETPVNPDLSLNTIGLSVEETVLEVVKMLEQSVRQTFYFQYKNTIISIKHSPGEEPKGSSFLVGHNSNQTKQSLSKFVKYTHFEENFTNSHHQ